MTPDLDLHPDTSANLHDAACEVAARGREEMHWPDWRSCMCKPRREKHSKTVRERPVTWAWLHGPRREDAK